MDAGFLIIYNIHTNLSQNDAYFKGKLKFNPSSQWSRFFVIYTLLRTEGGVKRDLNAKLVKVAAFS